MKNIENIENIDLNFGGGRGSRGSTKRLSMGFLTLKTHILMVLKPNN